MIQQFADWITFDLFKIAQGTALGTSVQFFVYDLSKILLMLFIITHVMSFVRTYLPLDRFGAFLQKKSFGGLEYLGASFLGAITPFCSCSSLPIFAGFLQSGVPAGFAFAFLITSPLVNEVALALFWGIFGWKITMIYFVSGIVLGVLGGKLLSSLHAEQHLRPITPQKKCTCTPTCTCKKPSIGQRIWNASKEAQGIMRSLVIYLILGIALGATIHGFVPTGYFEQYLTESASWWSIPLSVILGVPMYANAAGVIPIIQALVAKGVPLATALAFMMAVVGLSLPEALILRRFMQWKLLGLFFGLVTVCIVTLGYFFQIVL